MPFAVAIATGKVIPRPRFHPRHAEKNRLARLCQYAARRTLLRLRSVVEARLYRIAVKIGRAAKDAVNVRIRRVWQDEPSFPRIRVSISAVVVVVSAVTEIEKFIVVVSADRKLVHSARDDRRIVTARARAIVTVLEIDAVCRIVGNSRVDVLIRSNLHPAVDEADVGGGECADDRPGGNPRAVEGVGCGGGRHHARIERTVRGRPRGHVVPEVGCAPDEVDLRRVVQRADGRRDIHVAAAYRDLQRGGISRKKR